jgi:hypothetical protein
LAKVIASGKPAILLLPLQILTPKKSYDLLKTARVDLIIMNPSPVCGVVYDVAWFMINMENSSGGFYSVERLST